MARFKVGDCVIVPHAYASSFEPYLTKIEEIKEDIDFTRYYCKVKRKNYFSFNDADEELIYDFTENELFSLDERKECEKFISNKYGGGLCTGCKYDAISGTIWHCNDCEHKLVVSKSTPADWDIYKCSLTGVVVGNQKQATCMGICKHYSPTLPQNKRDYVSWEHYEDILRNCEFNPECVHHKKSVHKTCSYDRYMNESVRVPMSFKYGDENVVYVRVKRSSWMEGDFINGDIVKCIGVGFAPQYTDKGNIKKGTFNRGVSFGVEAKINIKTGEVL